MKNLQYDFPLRLDRNGYRPVYKLGNELGPCPYGCKFCGVGHSEKVASEHNIKLFDTKHTEYLEQIDGPYHPAIFNRGNVTAEAEFSLRTLDHILDTFSIDNRVRYVSLNAREPAATKRVLDRLAETDLPFPIHFILGMESFSPRTADVLGKHNKGEMERFVAKLRPYNTIETSGNLSKQYTFGLDVNLVFLPELYLEEGEERTGNEDKIFEGIAQDIKVLVHRIDPVVPCEINIHPYYQVESIPYQNADVNMLLRSLPRMQGIVDNFNRNRKQGETHLFVGVVFLPEARAESEELRRIEELQTAFDLFNITGTIPQAA